MKHLLVAGRGDAGLAIELQRELRQALVEHEPTINIVMSGEQARGDLTLGDYDAVVAMLEFPEDQDRPVGSCAALSLVHWIRRERALNTRIAIIVPATRADLHKELDHFPDCIQVTQEDEDWIKRLTSFIRDGVSPPKPVVITFDCTLPPSEPWTYRITADGTDPKQGRITAQFATIRGARALSKNVIKFEEWEGQLRELGAQLGELLFRDNAGFRNDLHAVLSGTGSRKVTAEDTRVVFKVGPHVYPILFEAVHRPRQHAEHTQYRKLDTIVKRSTPVDIFSAEKKDRNYWMLHAPVIRSIRSDIAALDLWRDAPAPNCLIVEANSAGYYEAFRIPGFGTVQMDPPVVHVDLPMVAEECDVVESMFRALQMRQLVGQVRRLSAKTDAPLWQQFEDEMQEQWDIVHFAGHSYFYEPEQDLDDSDSGDSPRDGHGFIFFPSQDPRGPATAIHHSRFAQTLSKTKLVFISSCRSAGSGFAFALAKARVPVVISYHGDVNDEYAPEFAKAFYTEFLAKRDVASAFLHSRCEMYRAYKDDRIWVAPTLTVNSPVHGSS